MRRPLVVIGHLWALPTSLLGLLIITPSGARPYKLRPAGALWYVADRGFWRWWLERYGMAALTCGAVTVCLRGYEENEVMVRHERQHLLQAFCLGPLFVPAYYLLCVIQLVNHKSAYRDNPLEIAAYAKQDRPDGWG